MLAESLEGQKGASPTFSTLVAVQLSVPAASPI